MGFTAAVNRSPDHVLFQQAITFGLFRISSVDRQHDVIVVHQRLIGAHQSEKVVRIDGSDGVIHNENVTLSTDELLMGFGPRRVYDWWNVKSKQQRTYICLIGALVFLLLATSFIGGNRDPCLEKRKCSCDLIVPDVIHFYRADQKAENITNKEAACIRAALRLHGKVWIHTTDPLRVTQALGAAGLESSDIRVSYPPRGAGPIHLAILREYGGMFLKNDIYLVNRLDTMRGHELCSVGNDDIVAGTREGAITGLQVKLKGVLLDKDYGALYIRDIVNNCTYAAVRLELR